MPSVRSITLTNGLRIIHIPHNVGSVTACLRGLAGSSYESTQEVGAAHVLEHLCSFSSRNYDTPEKLRGIILSSGGRVTGTTSRDDVAYFAKVLKRDVPKAIEYLYEIFAHPELDQENLEKTKNIIKHEIYQNIEDPKRHIGRISYKILYPKQRLANYNTGGIQDLKALTLDDVMNFRKRLYYPANFVLSICGDLDSKYLFDLAEKYFGSIPGNKNPSSLLKLRPNYKAAFLAENRSNLAHMHLKIDYHGYKTSQKMRYPAYLLSIMLRNRLRNTIYAGANGRAVAPYILDSSSFSTNSYGLFGTYTAIDPAAISVFLKVYKNITEQLIKNNLSAQELNFCKSKAQADMEFALEKTSLLADYYSEVYLYDDLVENHLEEIKNYQQYTAKNVREAAREIFTQEPKMTIIDKQYNKADLKKMYQDIFLG